MIFKRVKFLESRVNALETKVKELGNFSNGSDSAFKIRQRQFAQATIPPKTK